MAEETDKKQEVVQEVPVVAERSSMPASPRSGHDIEKRPSKLKLRFLSAAALIILSLSAGFLGGWLG